MSIKTTVTAICCRLWLPSLSGKIGHVLFYITHKIHGLCPLYLESCPTEFNSKMYTWVQCEIQSTALSLLGVFLGRGGDMGYLDRYWLTRVQSSFPLSSKQTAIKNISFIYNFGFVAQLTTQYPSREKLAKIGHPACTHVNKALHLKMSHSILSSSFHLFVGWEKKKTGREKPALWWVDSLKHFEILESAM